MLEMVFNGVMWVLVQCLIAAYAIWFSFITQCAAVQAWSDWRDRRWFRALWWTFMTALGALYFGLVCWSQWKM